MPGTARRHKPLKAKSLLSDVTGVTVANAAAGDVLSYSGSAWVNTTTLTGTYAITNATITTLVATGATVSNALSVGGALSAGGALSITGTTTLVGAVTMDAALTVTGAATLSSTLSLAGTLTGAGFSMTGNGTVTGDLTVTGALTTGTLSLTNLSLTGTLTVGGVAVFNGTSAFNDDVTINANLSGQAIGGTLLSSAGAISGAGALDIAKIGWSASGQNVTAALKGSTGTYSVTGIQTDLTVQTMFTLDPDAHHVLGGVDGLLLPVGTTAQQPTGAAGMVRFDSDTARFRGYEAAWDNFAMDSDLHTQSHAMTSASDHTSGAWKTFYSNASALVELTVGAAGTVLSGNGVTSAPTWVTATTVMTNNTATAWRNFYSNASGVVTELILGAVGTVLTSGGASAAPTWSAAAAGAWGTLTGTLSDQTDLQTELDAKVNLAGDTMTGALVVGGVAASKAIDIDNSANATAVGFNIRNSFRGLEIRQTASTVLSFYQTAAAGTLEDLCIDLYQNADIRLYHNGILAAGSISRGWGVYPSSNAGDPNIRFLTAAAGTERALISPTSSNLIIRSLTNSGTVTIDGANAAAATKSMFLGNPDAGVTLYYAGVAVASTTSIGIDINPPSGTTAELDVVAAGTNIDGIIRARGASGGFMMWWDESAVTAYIATLISAGTLEDRMIAMNPNSTVDLYYNGIKAFETAAEGVNSRRTTGTTTVHRLQNASGTNEGGVFSTASSAYLYSYNHGGLVQLWGEDAGGTARLVLSGDPDDYCSLYYAGTKACMTEASGIRVYDPSGADDPYVRLYQTTGETYAAGFWSFNGGIYLDNAITGGAVNGRVSAAGYLDTTWLLVTAAAGVKLYYANAVAFETISGSIKFGTRTASADAAVSGYITIQDSGGTSRKLAVIT